MGTLLETGNYRPGPGDRERRLAITGGTVWTEDGPRQVDVLIEGERIAALEPPGSLAAPERIDASGCHVLPGLIDVHVHLDDEIGPYTLADDFPSGTVAAVQAGITTIAAFATQRADESLTDCVTRYLAKGRSRSLTHFTFHVTPTQWPWPWDEVESLVARGFRTFKLYTTYREAGLYTSWERLEVVMARLAQLGATLLLHCEDDDLLAGIDPRTADLSNPASHTRLRPEAAEVEAIQHALAIAERTACPLHVVHVSTAQGAELIAAARSRTQVTCETGPQYLLLDEAALQRADGHRFLCTPPLRSAATRVRMEQLAAIGAFDCFATDHCAFRRADKDRWDGRDLRQVPNGLAGIGALAPLLCGLLVRQHGLPLGELALRLAANPAKLLGIFPRKGVIRPGSDADLVVVNASGAARPMTATFADAYDPWWERTTSWEVRAVLVAGGVVVASGKPAEASSTSGLALAG